MNQASPSVSDEVPRQVMGRKQGLVLGLEDHARDVATRPAINCNLFDAYSLIQKDQLHRVTAPVETKSPLDMPTDFALSHLFRLHCAASPILQSARAQTKPGSTTLANITPPRDLRTQLHPAPCPRGLHG